MISHNMEHVFQVVDRLVILRRGKSPANATRPRRLARRSLDSSPARSKVTLPNLWRRNKRTGAVL